MAETTHIQARELQALISRTLTEQPVGFEAGGRHFELYQPTLGRVYVTAPIIEALGIDGAAVKTAPLAEALRIVASHRDAACRIIAYGTIRTTDQPPSYSDVTRRAAEIAESLDDEGLATLLLAILRDTSTDEIARATGMDKEAEGLRRANKAKDSRNSLVFGGKTVWGTLADAACERYGWTLGYVLWGISYANLTLMLKDKITTVYLSDSERKRVHIPDRSGSFVNGSDKDAVMRLIRQGG